jgi:hypothetical protein
MNHWDATRYHIYKRDPERILDDIKVLMKDKAEIVALPGMTLSGDWTCDGLRKGQKGGGCPTLIGTWTTTAYAVATVWIKPHRIKRRDWVSASTYSHLVVPTIPVSMGDMDIDTPTNIPKNATFATWTFRHAFRPSTSAIDPFEMGAKWRVQPGWVPVDADNHAAPDYVDHARPDAVPPPPRRIRIL